MFLDRVDEARAEAAEILKLKPEVFRGRMDKKDIMKDKAYTERYADALRKAGLPDEQIIVI